MNTPNEIRDKLKFHANRLAGVELAESETWAVIHLMENCWRTEPVKVRAANRRGCLVYLFGVNSTKLLAPGQIAALRKWMAFSDDREAELRAVLQAVLVDAGQLELAAQP